VLDIKKDLDLYRELYGIHNLFEEHDTLQFYTFIFSSLKNYEMDTKEYKEALRLINQSIKEVIEQFKTHFENRILTEVVYLGTINKYELTPSLKNILQKNMVQEELQDLFLPNIYLKEQTNRLKICNEIKEVSKIKCNQDVSNSKSMRKVLSVKEIQQNNFLMNMTNSTYIPASSLDVSDQQTFIWTIFLLIVITILTLVFVDSIDYSSDSLFIATELMK